MTQKTLPPSQNVAAPNSIDRDVHEALLDSQYRAGAKAGWNAAQLPEDQANAKIAALIKVEAGALAALRRPKPPQVNSVAYEIDRLGKSSFWTRLVLTLERFRDRDTNEDIALWADEIESAVMAFREAARSALGPSPQPNVSGLADFANRLFNLQGFMLLEEYRGKPAVTVTFPNQEEANQFHGMLVELSRHRDRDAAAAGFDDDQFFSTEDNHELRRSGGDD